MKATQIAKMIEIFTEGFVLDRTPSGELDEVVSIFTKDLGKVAAFAKSSRKITSRLSGHLKPGRYLQLRLVEKNKLQLVDALSRPSLANPRKLLLFLHFLNRLLPERDADLKLWHLVRAVISRGEFGAADYRRLIESLGFGSASFCQNCGQRRGDSFLVSEAVFLCRRCLAKLKLTEDEFIVLAEV